MTCEQELIPTDPTERDWHARAWERLRDVRAKHLDWTLDDALRHPTIGPVIRGFAAQLRRQHINQQEIARKEARFGRKVEWNGYGYKPVHPKRR